MPIKKNLTVIIPAFNEDKNIGNVINGIKKYSNDIVKKIIVINDGSTDETSLIASKKGATVIDHPINLGYGSSLKTGILNSDTEYILTFDADGQHDPKDIKHLWENADKNDMIVGKRNKIIHSSLWRMPGKWLLGKLANYLSNRKIPDLNSGLRIINCSVARRYLHLCPSGFSFSTTITMILLNQGYRVSYQPININKREDNSSLVKLSTGFDSIMLILRIASLFNPLRIFMPISIFIGISGILYGLIVHFINKLGLSTTSMLMILTSILIFMMGLICDQISQLRLEKYR